MELIQGEKYLVDDGLGSERVGYLIYPPNKEGKAALKVRKHIRHGRITNFLFPTKEQFIKKL
jgi:hypothetical protein